MHACYKKINKITIALNIRYYIFYSTCKLIQMLQNSENLITSIQFSKFIKILIIIGFGQNYKTLRNMKEQSKQIKIKKFYPEGCLCLSNHDFSYFS